MKRAPPHIRQAGSGPGVVCLHANASSSSQWRELTDMLSDRYRVVAPDCYGSGKSPPMPSDRMLTLTDEAVFLETAFASAGTPFALVAHSYGAAVALIAALADRGACRPSHSEPGGLISSDRTGNPASPRQKQQSRPKGARRSA